MRRKFFKLLEVFAISKGYPRMSKFYDSSCISDSVEKTIWNTVPFGKLFRSENSFEILFWGYYLKNHRRAIIRIATVHFRELLNHPNVLPFAWPFRCFSRACLL